jgi:hypothetical protein
VALNPLVAIAGPESSFGTNLYNPTSSATGIWQDLTGTWDYALQGIGLSPSQYPTAASAPPSVQAAANAYLYNQQGFGPWAPYDPTLAGQIAAAGGTGAYAAPGSLSTNPADYASLDQPSGLQAFFSNPSNPPISLSADVASPQVASQLFPTTGFGADMGLSSYGAAPFTGSYYDPTTGQMTPYDYSTTSGGSTGATPGSSGGTFLSWTGLVSDIEGFFVRAGVFGLGIVLVGIAVAAIVWTQHGSDIKRAARAAVG